METDLAQHIEETPLVDTHEHMQRERVWLEDGPDILQGLFGHYVKADLCTAGASEEAMEHLLDGSDPDIASRFGGIEEAWNASQFTGYGEAVRLIAKHAYGLDELTIDGIVAAQGRTTELRTPGERYRLLHDVANLDHIQTDDGRWPCPPDHSGLDFFLYDLSWMSFCHGGIDFNKILKETGSEVTDLLSLKRVMEEIFAKHAPRAIAVKSQHAYWRTLHWIERSDTDAAAALDVVLRRPADQVGTPTIKGRQAMSHTTQAALLCLGDWCWAKGVELSIEHDLPFKIHTGYYAGNDRMPVDFISAGNMCDLLACYPDAKFVLMHIAYPYCDELVALAKHYRNVWVDLCWGWCIDPYSARDFVRRFIHAVPINKLFAFGGDAAWPIQSMAYAMQARQGIRAALEGEIGDGALTERQAIGIATRIMRENQYDCFDVEGTRANIRSAE